MTWKQNKKNLPNFNKMSYAEEVKWWESHDTADYLGAFDVVEFRYEPDKLATKKPKTKALNMAIDAESLNKLRTIAKSRGIGHSTLARIWILEKLSALELKASAYKEK